MKKKNIIYIVIGVIILLLIAILLIILNQNNTNPEPPKKIIKDNSFYKAGNLTNEELIEDNMIFTNYEEYHKIFEEGELTEDSFLNNNYVLISILFDSCSESSLTPTKHTIKNNKIDVTFSYEGHCGVCAPEKVFYLLEVDKILEEAKVNISYEMVNKPECDPNVTYKPLIYLYPTEEINVSVEVGHPELLTTTYPKYKNGWNMKVMPNGDLIDENNNTYYGLYWEGNNYIDNHFEDGFVVEKKDLISFLEEKLTILGLNERERNEFIIYWLPELEKNNYNLIRFESLETINEQMPLYINPKPDTIIRIFMKFKPIEEKKNIKEQVLETPNRIGFTVVEWGGTNIKEKNLEN